MEVMTMSDDPTEDEIGDSRYHVFFDDGLLTGLRSETELEEALVDRDLTTDDVEIVENEEYEPPVTWVRVVGIHPHELGGRSVSKMVDLHNSVKENHRIVRTELFNDEGVETDE